MLSRKRPSPADRNDLLLVFVCRIRLGYSAVGERSSTVDRYAGWRTTWSHRAPPLPGVSFWENESNRADAAILSPAGDEPCQSRCRRGKPLKPNIRPARGGAER